MVNSSFLGFRHNNSMSPMMRDFCTYHTCIYGSDFATDDFMNRLVDKHRNECLCWERELDWKYGFYTGNTDFSDTADHQCCTDKGNDSNWTIAAASCECIIQRDCAQGYDEKCHAFGEYCCGEDDNCRCENLRKACNQALKVKDLENIEYFCLKASESCCGSSGDIGLCSCDFWEPLCFDYPSFNVVSYLNSDFSPCSEAENACCSENNLHCQCDFRTFTIDTLGYEQVSWKCNEADNVAVNHIMEVESLRNFYAGTSGDHWFNNSGWMVYSDHCAWHGISCDAGKHITEIKMRSNNISGAFPSNSFANLYNLQKLDLANNNIWGSIAGTIETLGGVVVNDTSLFSYLRVLTDVDLSHNKLVGEVDLLFAPALENVNFSHNNFSTIRSYKHFKPSYQTLQTCDLTNNSIQNDADEILKDLPLNIEQLVLSDNLIQGALSKSLNRLERMRELRIDSNGLSGSLPDMSTSFPNLQVLNLSNQNRGNASGLRGTIPVRLSNLQFLTYLAIAGNHFTGSIPEVLGNFALMEVLDLSDNKLTHPIPPDLGKLSGTLEVIDLSTNMLTGIIPLELGRFEKAVVRMSGNVNISIGSPAPVSLCLLDKFDLKHDTRLCPPERNALTEFFESTEGPESEWSNATNWMKPYSDHCTWHGVKCSADGVVTSLNLTNNGLSGRLAATISNLTFLKTLDLSDNDIVGGIPSELGKLSYLTRLRLSYNSFVGTVPDDLQNLTDLELVQLHSNRISGEIPDLNVVSLEDFSFVADCGVPSDFESPPECKKCTMCCNAQGECQPNEGTNIQKQGFKSYQQFTWVFFLSVFGLCCILALLSNLHRMFKKRSRQGTHRHLNRRESAIHRDKFFALNTIGNDSVYQFFIGKSLRGWIIALATLAVQIWMLLPFVRAAEGNVADDISDLEFVWRCPRDKVECDYKADWDAQGWILFGIIMACHLLKDIINGFKMVVLATREGHDRLEQIQYFLGGFFLNSVTFFTLYASTIYNKAIATSNSELVINAVLILFITETDEYVYKILLAINEDWVKGVVPLEGSEGGLDVKEKIRRMNHELQHLQRKTKRMEDRLQQREFSTTLQDDVDEYGSNFSSSSSESKGSRQCYKQNCRNIERKDDT